MMHQNLLRQRQLLSTRSSNSNEVASTSSKSRRKTHEVVRRSNKKRGVYVEIKRTETSLASHGQNQNSFIRSNLPNRTNANSSLIASVLDVLSKSSTVTCLAEEHPSKRTLTPKTRETVPRSQRKGVEDKRSVPKTPSKLVSNPRKERKSNHSAYNQEETKPIIVLKPNTNTTQSSFNKERNTTNYPKVTRGAKPASKIKYKAMASDKHTEETGVDLQEQPSTLVSKIVDDKTQAVDTMLVELLETSFNVFNVVAEYESPEHTDLKLSDLNVKFANTEENFKADDEDIIFAEPDYLNEDQMNKRRVQPVAKERHSFMSAKSRSYYKSYLAKQQQKLLTTKKPKKHTLLNILKKDLASDARFMYEEPTNFYEALKVMARNKEKNRKRLNFNETTSSESPDDAECVFKRRKLLSTRRRNRKRVKKNTGKDEYVYKYVQPIPSHMSEIIEDGVESYHSLQIQD